MRGDSVAKTTLLDWALRYIRLGWPVLPLRGKLPRTKNGSKDATRNEAQAEAWWAEWPDANIGVATGHRFFVLDVDLKDGGEDSFDYLRSQHGALPDTIQQITGTGGKHLLFAPPDFPVRNSAGKLAPGIDIRGAGGYIVVAPSVHSDTGRRYFWDGLALLEEQKLLQAPAWLLAWLKGQGAATETKPEEKVPGQIASGARNTTLFKIAASLRRKGFTAEEILATLRVTNARRCAPALEESELAVIANSVGRYAPDAKGDLFRGAKKESAEPRNDGGTGDCGGNDPVPDLLPFLYNDHGNSQRFIAMYGDDVRYCPPMRKWLRWDGQRWVIDEADKCRSLVKATFLEFLRQSIEGRSGAAEKFALSSLNSKGVSNALREAQDQMVVMPADLDAHAYFLTFQNGVMDLRSGRLMEHDRALMLTKLIHHRYNPSAQCPRFLKFLDRIAGITSDSAEASFACAQELISFLQKALGYSLTGVTSEKVVFVLYGPRDNGKSTLLATIYNLLDECAALLQIDTLMVKPGGENSNTQADLADLRGARFVMTSETEQGARLAEAKLKRITQGLGRIKATRKYENPIEFDETHKLWIDANYLPVVRSGDEAIWRRLRAIPFSVIIPREEQDRELSSKLMAEAEGILAWMVAGAVRWHREGLGTVSPVEQTSSDWRQDMNQVGRFADECCVKDDPSRSFTSGVAVRAKDLYEAYKTWSVGNGERYMSQRAFTQQIVDTGFTREHRNDGNYYKGIELRAPGLSVS